MFRRLAALVVSLTCLSTPILLWSQARPADSSVQHPNPAIVPPIALPETTVVQSNAANGKAQQVIRDVMSPFCPGLSLEACPSPDAQILRTEIRREMAAGKTEQEIRASLVTRYGRAVLGTPPDDAFGMIAWAMPWVALITGAIAITLWLRRRTHRTNTDGEASQQSDVHTSVHTLPRSPVATSHQDDELIQRIRAEVARGDVN